MNDRQSGASRLPLKWHESLQTRLTISFVVFLGVMVGAVVLVVQIVGHSLLVQENYRLIETNGNRIVSDLGNLLAMTESLTAALANMGEAHEPDAEEYHEVIPEMMDLERQSALIAGGGIWPEPFAFDPNLERSSFFWGRNEVGQLEYFGDYNDADGAGYHNEEWYVPARYVAEGSCFWSQSYMDPYSFQPMVTCTVPMRDEDEQYIGSATVDLRLESMHDFFDSAAEVTGGYAFAVDRNNKFISYPDEKMTKIETVDGTGNISQEFIYAVELANKEPRFAPIATELEAINRKIENLSREETNYDPALAETIANDSYQINFQDAQLIAAILRDPLAEETQESNLLSQFTIEDDAILGEDAQVAIFHMPDAYWKIVLVTPMSKATEAAVFITETVLTSLILVVFLLSLITFVMLRRYFVNPVQQMTHSLQNSSGQEADLSLRLDDAPRNELGELAFWFNQRTRDLQTVNEQLQRESAERARVNATLEALLSAIPDGIFQLNADGVFTTYIPSREFMPQMSPQDFLGKQFEDVMPSDLAAMYQEETKQLFANGRMRIFEYTYIKEGSPIHFEARYKKIDDDAALLIVRDITKRKQAQQALVTYANELERSNREYQDFAYVASHDLQEPLRKIQTFGDRLGTRSAGNLDDHSLMYLTRMQGAAQRMQKLIVDLLAFSRVSTQGMPFKTVNLNKVIRLVMLDLETKIEEVGATIAVADLQDVEADATQMRQLFQNLLENALKFSKPNVAPLVEINGRILPGSKLYEIRAKDNGIGFDEKYNERIFLVFQRLYGRSAYEGTGVGLAICKRIVDRHQGIITAESSLNEGATFIIQIPIKQP